MSCENCNDELRSVYRLQNRTLRIVNRNLRRRLETSEKHADEVFFSLCETDPRAESVLREVCEKAGIEFSADDYDNIADKLIERLTTSSNPTHHQVSHASEIE